MNCQEVLESVTAAVDGALPRELFPQFQDHITRCPQCRSEYELERATKSLVSSRLRSQAAPQVLREKVSAALAGELAQSTSDPAPGRGIFGRRGWRFTFALGGTAIAAAALILFVTPGRSHHPHTSPNDDNIIHQTYNNYDGVLDGKLVPQVTSSDPSVVRAYMQPAVDFRVNVPTMKQYTLVGGKSSLYKNHHLAHLVYKHGKDVVYMYQARYSDVLDGTTLSLPPKIIDELKRTGWYVEGHVPDCTLIVWITDSLVCCVVADVDKDQLLASLQESE